MAPRQRDRGGNQSTGFTTHRRGLIMPFTSDQIAQAAKVGLDFYVKNNPVDQIAVDRPLMSALNARKKEFPGAKEYVVEQLRKSYDSNFQWYRGAGAVSYNERHTIEQAKYPWCSAHDGLMIDEDRLSQNGIIVTDDRRATATDAEKIQLTNLLTEQSEVLTLGYQEKFSAALHLDGAQAVDAVAGLDHLVSIAAYPNATSQQVVGGLDRYTYPWWRNHRETGLAAATILPKLEDHFRACSRVAGRPTHIFAGKDWVDVFREAATDPDNGGIARFLRVPTVGGTDIDPSVTGLAFHGIKIEWCPEWDDNFGGMVSPSVSWAKRGYMLNLKHIKLRPLAGQDQVSRKPPRPHDRYVVYMALTWKGAMTMNMGNAHSVTSVT
jgi:hypothetical protein